MLDQKLQTLIVVAEERNFTRAAEKLNLTQPAVSHQIKELEIEFRTQIFIRRKGDVILTPSGELILGYAKRWQAMEQKLRQEIKDFEQRKVNLKVGITHTAESNLTTEIVSQFLNNHKEISITMITDKTAKLIEMVENYQLDFAIVDQRINNKLNYHQLDTDYLVCVLNNDSPLVNKQIVTLEELKKERLILRLPSSSTRIQFDASLETIGESITNFNVILEADNIATIKELVRKNMGVSILAKSACINDARRNKLTILPIENLSLVRKTYLVYPKDFFYHDYIHELSKIYRQISQEREE